MLKWTFEHANITKHFFKKNENEINAKGVGERKQKTSDVYIYVS